MFKLLFGYVIVCMCVCVLLCRHERYVALKIVKSARHYTETAMDEIELLKRVCFKARKLPEQILFS